MTARGVSLSDGDRAVVHACWSLGYASRPTLRSLVCPQRPVEGFRTRLRALLAAGHLVQQRYGLDYLLGAGPMSRPPGAPAPWRPGLSQLHHTLDVGEALVALTRPGRVPEVEVTGWRGEAELRAWALPGAPFPDAWVGWACAGRTGAWLLEVDRATESRAAWRAKLGRYLAQPPEGVVLVLTTSGARAGNIAALAAELGVDLLAGVLQEVREQADPAVLDTRVRARRPLSAAAAAT